MERASERPRTERAERMDEQAERICGLAQALAATHDPDAALRALTELRTEIDAFVRVQVGAPWQAAGRSAMWRAPWGSPVRLAHRRFRDLAPKGRVERTHALVATDAVRRAVRIDPAEAYAAGTTPGSGHVLLGVLRTDCDASRALRFEDCDASRALRFEGVTLRAGTRLPAEQRARRPRRALDAPHPQTGRAGGAQPRRP